MLISNDQNLPVLLALSVMISADQCWSVLTVMIKLNNAASSIESAICIKRIYDQSWWNYYHMSTFLSKVNQRSYHSWFLCDLWFRSYQFLFAKKSELTGLSSYWSVLISADPEQVRKKSGLISADQRILDLSFYWSALTEYGIDQTFQSAESYL